MSRYGGSSALLCQGGGGNASVKEADRLLVKASGLRMQEVTESSGWVEVSISAVREMLWSEELGTQPELAAHEESVRRTNRLVEGSIRPSMETAFHAMLGTCVLHTHAVYANAFTCMVGGRDALAECLGEHIWVKYRIPGFWLARAIAGAVGDRTCPIYLENHGLITFGGSAAAAIEAHEEAIGAGTLFFGALPADALDEQEPERVGQATYGTRFRWLDGLAKSAPELLTGPPLIPDDAVYNGWGATLAAAPGRGTTVVPGRGLYFTGSPRWVEAAEENLLASALVRHLIARRGAVRELPAHEVRVLMDMEAEKYRQRMIGG